MSILTTVVHLSTGSPDLSNQIAKRKVLPGRRKYALDNPEIGTYLTCFINWRDCQFGEQKGHQRRYSKSKVGVDGTGPCN